MSHVFDRRRLARTASRSVSAAKSFVRRNKRGLKSAAYLAAGAALLGTALAMGKRKFSKSRKASSRRSSRKSSRSSRSSKKSSRSSRSRSKSKSRRRR